MGYETRIHVVDQYTFTGSDGISIGDEIASIDLCKCGDGPVARLIGSKTKKVKKVEKPPFALWAREPDRQQEAVKILRKIAASEEKCQEHEMTQEEMKKLSNHIEDGTITDDKYGDFLGVIDIDDMIKALEEEEEYRRFQWALALLKAIKASYTDSSRLKVVTYGH